MKLLSRIKLRTRITLIAGLVILLAAAVSDGIIWMICRRALMSEAEQTALRQMAMLKSDVQLFQMRSDAALSDQELAFFFKNRGDDYAICLRGKNTVFNQTVLTADDLDSVNVSRTPDYTPYVCGYTEISGTPLLIAEAILPDALTLYHITDLSVVSRRLRQLAFGMIAVLLCISLLAGVLLYLLLRRTFYPLQMLSESAKHIAAGAYDERAAVSGTDEVGLLAQDFNLMAQAVQEKIGALAESEQQKTMFMADFSHELKTPLTAISGYAQTLRTVKLSEDDRTEALGYIYSESRRLDRLAKKMMRLMQLDRTEALQMKSIDNQTLLDAVIATCKPAAEQKGVSLQIGKCEGCINGDFDLLHDALCNLTDNAVKASKTGQIVLLSASDSLLTVADCGCGIPQDEITHLTDPFYMVDKSRSRESGGAGLGLSIVAQINRVHGIKMEIESEPNRGTRINLHFVYAPLNT